MTSYDLVHPCLTLSQFLPDTVFDESTDPTAARRCRATHEGADHQRHPEPPDPAPARQPAGVALVARHAESRPATADRQHRSLRHTAAALAADFAQLESEYQQVLIAHPSTVTVICGDMNCNLLKADSDRPKRRCVHFGPIFRCINVLPPLHLHLDSVLT